MSTAAVQLNRITSLLAELTQREHYGEPPLKLDELAELLSTTPKGILADLRKITQLSDSAEAEWLLSLQLTIEGEHVGGFSGGPFRRPMRFTPEELLVLQLAAAVGGADDEPTPGMLQELAPEEIDVAARLAPHPSRQSREATDVALDAIATKTIVEVEYAADGDEPSDPRRVHPYQVVTSRGTNYLVGWCEARNDWRRFRFDRMVSLRVTDAEYTRRDDCPYDSVFAEPACGVDEVRVRFAPTIARWIKERYCEVAEEADGSVTVIFEASSPDWLVGHVLQYGPNAEVLGPLLYRRAMRDAVTLSGK